MAYATATEFKQRYATKLLDTDLSSHFLPFASARLEQLLAPTFTVPFSDNNQTAKDLTIDLAYLLILQRSREPQESAGLQARVTDTIRGLSQGALAMISTSGDTLYGQLGDGQIWSSTAQGTPLFEVHSGDSRLAPDFTELGLG